MRVVTGTISHETNTFSVRPTTLDNFRYDRLAPRSVEKGFITGQDFFEEFRGVKNIPGGFIDASEKLGFELIPSIWANATPGGTVSREAFNYLLSELLEGIKGAGCIDGVLLGLHGGGYSEAENDLEGKILKEVRSAVGDLPVVSTLDLHANVSLAMVENANVLVGFDTYPHVDTYERGLEGAEILVKIIKGEIKPEMAMEKIALIPPLQAQFTERHPMSRILELAHRIEQERSIVNATVSACFPMTDSSDTCMSLIVTTNNDKELAAEKARQLAELAWSLRRDFLVKPTPVDAAVDDAIQSTGPVVLADIGDNPGAGTPCDGTTLVRALLEASAKNTVVAVITDPEAAAKAITAGVGNDAALTVGGKTDRMHGEPLKVTGRVRLISDGKFVNKGPMGAGSESRMGRTVVLDCQGVELILTELRTQPTDLQLYRSLGIEPSEKQIIVVKSSVHYRAAHTPIASKMIEVDTPGISSPDLKRYSFKNIRRPIFPLDDL